MNSRQDSVLQNSNNTKPSFLSSVLAFSIFSKRKLIKELDEAMAEAKRNIAKADENEMKNMELNKKIHEVLIESDNVIESLRSSRNAQN